jgi:hypothetical protein
MLWPESAATAIRHPLSDIVVYLCGSTSTFTVAAESNDAKSPATGNQNAGDREKYSFPLEASASNKCSILRSVSTRTVNWFRRLRHQHFCMR